MKSLIFLPNVKSEPHGELAQDVPSRSEEKARPVTDTRVGSTALLGSVSFDFRPFVFPDNFKKPGAKFPSVVCSSLDFIWSE